MDVDTTGKKIALRQDIDAGKPFSIATYQTTATLKESGFGAIEEIDSSVKIECVRVCAHAAETYVSHGKRLSG